jgi:hypothetical protein
MGVIGALNEFMRFKARTNIRYEHGSDILCAAKYIQFLE